MKIFFALFIFLFISGIGFCQSSKTNNRTGNSDEEIILIEEKANKKYNLTAKFYGVSFRFGENDEITEKIVRYIIFRDNSNGDEIKYEASGSVPTGKFYFNEIWSPDEEFLVLPIGMFEGFGVFKTKNALEDIKSNKFFDTIKVKSKMSGWFSHDFEKWEDDSTFSFRAGLYGDMFAFKYNVTKSELYCYEEDCQESDVGENNKGKTRAIKKGDIEVLKKH